MKRLLVILSVFILIFAVGCGTKNDGKTGSDPAPQPEKEYKVATEAAFPPFESVDGKGNIIGFDAEILDAISNAAGFKANLENTSWDGMLNGVENGTYEIGISAVTITEDRKKVYDFSDPYFNAKQLILVPKNSTVTTLAELNGKKVGVQSATTGEKVVQEAFGKTSPNIKGYDAIPSAIQDLKIGRLDAVVVDNAVVNEYLKTLGEANFKIIDDPSVPKEEYGLIVKKGNAELIGKINEGLAKIKADGTYDKIFEKYFDTNE